MAEIIKESEGAYLRMHKNEVTLDQKPSFEDPVKYRGGTFAPTGYYVIVSGDRLEGDPTNPVHREQGYFGLRHNDDYPASVKSTEFIVFLQDNDGTEDATMRLRFRLTKDYLEVLGRRIPLDGSGSGVPATLQSPNGRVMLAAQDDGNLVLYVDGAPVKALFGLPENMLW